MFFPRKVAFFHFLLLSSVYGDFQTTGCNQGTEVNDINNAVDDVVDVASSKW